MTDHAHTTVLLHEAVDALLLNDDGFYVDGTFGRGGHSGLILSRLDAKGHLLAIDRDPQAVAEARARFGGDARFQIYHGPFSEMAQAVADAGMMGKVDGILLDLGVSSPQLDDAERGFSFQHDGPLDMRMDTTRGQSAAAWVASAKEEEISRVLWEYGEERYSRRMAKALVKARAAQPITRTAQLAKVIADAHPAWERGRHPATKAFQAIRIHINGELDELEALLNSAVPMLKIGGRLVVISFHSLEDRRVKRFMRDQEQGKPLPRGLPIPDSDSGKTLRRIGKAIKPDQVEVDSNVRSRSAVMRVAEKVADLASVA